MLENIVFNLYQKIRSHTVIYFSQKMKFDQIKQEYNFRFLKTERLLDVIYRHLVSVWKVLTFYEKPILK